MIVVSQKTVSSVSVVFWGEGHSGSAAFVRPERGKIVPVGCVSGKNRLFLLLLSSINNQNLPAAVPADLVIHANKKRGTAIYDIREVE